MTKILGKLAAILAEVEYIKKDKSNEFHRYRYASEEAIKKAIHPLLAKYKVLFQVAITDVVNTAVERGKGSSNLTTIKLIYAFYDCESGERIEGTFAGAGEDAGDKGIWKAVTGAIKYILTTTFLIPTGDDPETDTPAKPKRQSKNIYVETFVQPKGAAPADKQPQGAGLASSIKRIYSFAKAAGVKSKADVFSWITKETGVTVRQEQDFTESSVDFILDFLEKAGTPLNIREKYDASSAREYPNNPL